MIKEIFAQLFYIENTCLTLHSLTMSNYQINFEYIISILLNILEVIKNIWNHKLFTTDGQEVAISNLLIAMIFLILGLKLAKYLSNLVYHKLLKIISLDVNVSNLLGKILHYIFIVVVTLIVLNIAHVPLTAFTFIGGALAVSIGIGGQHVINNFISGLILMIENSIKVGDLVEVDNIIGRVISVDARHINIRTTENKNVLIPHSIMLQNKVINWTDNDNKVRISTQIEINHKSVPIEELRNIIINAVIKCQDVLSSPKPQVLLISFSRNIITLDINFWINVAFANRSEVISDVNLIISQIFIDNNFDFAIDYNKFFKK